MFPALLFAALVTAPQAERSSDRYLRELDELSALWSSYKYHYVQNGRVVELDEHGITTSEGQSYAMLRAVWSHDRASFDQAWAWTRDNLRVRRDALFAWKWNGGVVDANSASDADVDIALALVLAATVFDEPGYARYAKPIIKDIWAQEVVVVAGKPYLSAGNWAAHESPVTIRVGYLAPAAYAVFAGIDRDHDWRGLVDSSYDLLERLLEQAPVPCEVVMLDRRNGSISRGKGSVFGYDDVPLFFRLALDARWNGRSDRGVRARLMAEFAEIYERDGKIVERYDGAGHPLSQLEGLPHYASLHALALVENPDLARRLASEKLTPLFAKALENRDTPYYLHNWLWFDRAFTLERTVHGSELFDFLRPFDIEGFLAHFPVWWVLASLVLYFAAKRSPRARVAFVVSGLLLCARYLVWRLTSSLNFVEVLGPVISVALWCAEAYSFATVVLLVLQIGLRPRPRPLAPADPSFAPTVDVLIPIYSESIEILDKTLTAAAAMRYANKKLWVCDDSHRDAVRECAESHGAGYIKGPKKHAKAGNLNNAMTVTSGELVLVFDTDHIPVSSFLDATVPPFADPKMAVVQTPHHFYNDDIFQRAFRLEGVIPNEQDLFNHAIQNGRDAWGGAFFVGSGAVFRRRALEENGGFNLLSITEDIHTSQHLHARGWTTRFVDQDLAVGLTAENLSSYLVQRRRWMLGCLQIFLKDNPLLHRGLPWRLKLGYFASLFYFLHPMFRVIYWLTPLYFLFFHLHPLFADLPELLAYLIPASVFLPMVSAALVPRWPRFGWAVVYELVASFPLFRAMFDLFLPKSLGFKVTPKGIVSSERSFDLSSSMFTAVATLITVAAIIKGMIELYAFGIERDAYILNIGWATVNLLGLGVAMLVAWERPQRRVDDRLRREFRVRFDGHQLGVSTDVSLSGCGVTVVRSARTLAMAPEGELTLDLFDTSLTVKAHRVYEAPARMGFRFDATPEERRTLLLQLFGHPKSWENAHAHEPRSNLTMFGLLMKGIVRAVLPALVLLVCSSAHAEGIKESWYLMRGRANMEIGNYKAAIEAYEKATEINPNNRDAMKTLGQAYEQQGLYDKAVEQYDKYLARFPTDTDESFAQAERLKWSRYSYRRKDAIRYYRQGLEKRDDPTMRLELAHLLAQDKKDVRPALEEYEHLLEQDPNNPTVRREYQKLLLWDDAQGARAIPEYERIWKTRHDYDSGKTLAELYARDPSRHDQAVAQYRELAKMRPDDIKTRRAYAGLLAQRSSTRDEAIDEYGQLAKAGDRESRLAYAGLLASDDDTLPQAIEQYQIAAKDSKDARPHVGLARAYSRMYERDKALSEARIAKKLAPNDPMVARLGYELEGRDGPAVSAKLDFLVQPTRGQNTTGTAPGFKLYGVSATATGSVEIARRVVAGLHGGGEHFWNGAQSGSGGVIGGFAEVLVRDGDLVSARLDEHTLAKNGEEVELAYDHRDGPWRVRPSFGRALRYDSYTALVGVGASGAARGNLGRVDIRYESSRVSAWAAPHLGVVTALTNKSNFQIGGEAGAEWYVVHSSMTRLGLGASSYLTHYGADAIASDQYFSPTLFWSNGVSSSLSMTRDAHELRLAAGPAIQYENSTETPGVWRFGGSASVSYNYTITPSLAWESSASVNRVAPVYTRFLFSTRLVYAY